LALKTQIQNLFRRALPFAGIEFSRGAVMQSLLRSEIDLHLKNAKVITPDSSMLQGYKCYSQFDEDGIIAHITDRLGIENGTFVEFGAGNGLENNTHLLVLKGWRGLWVDGSPKNAEFIRSHVPENSKILSFDSSFITLENVGDVIERGLEQVECQDIDLLNMDLDGNDAYLLEKILTQWRPKVIVAEYNGKLPFGLQLTVPYNPNHWRSGDDFFGASLSELIHRLKGYRLVCCGLSGVNAYFVRDDLANSFSEYDASILYQPARVHLTFLTVGSPPSLKFLAMRLKEKTAMTSSHSENMQKSK
jgi:hypothetical protein